jgi:hypothetical protein
LAEIEAATGLITLAVAGEGGLQDTINGIGGGEQTVPIS